MKAEDIQDEIVRLFKDYDYPWITSRIKIEDLRDWTEAQSNRLGLERQTFRDRTSALYWAIAHVQLSLGHALIARQSIKDSQGVAGTLYESENMPNVMGIPGLHFWYHSSQTVECLYRCWERLAGVLVTSCALPGGDKLYFDGAVNKLGEIPAFHQHGGLKKLRDLIKHWNKVAGVRNSQSHQNSSPMQALSFTGSETSLIGPYGKRIRRIDYSYDDVRQEIERLVGWYRHLEPAVHAVVKFVDGITPDTDQTNA